MTARFGGQAAAAAGRFGAAAVGVARDGLATRIAVAAPEIAVALGEDCVRFSAPGLLPRVFGSRRRGPDPRLLALLGGDR